MGQEQFEVMRTYADCVPELRSRPTKTSEGEHSANDARLETKQSHSTPRQEKKHLLQQKAGFTPCWFGKKAPTMLQMTRRNKVIKSRTHDIT